jgi:hypothetical protein
MKHTALLTQPKAVILDSQIKRLPLLFIAFALILPSLLTAQLEISGTGPFTISFDNTVSGVNNASFTGSGFQPAPSAGLLDSDAWASTGMDDGDLAFGGTGTSGDFARGSSTGGVTTGGFYAFDTGAGDNCLGIQPGGDDWTPGTITLRIQNTSGSPVTSFQIDYEIKVFNDKDRSNSFNFFHSSDDMSYTPVGALDYASPEAKNTSPSWQTINRSTTLSGLNIANDAYYYLRWSGNDVGGSGFRDEFGLDDIVISSVVLPVTLSSFNASIDNNSVQLTWQTLSETNNDYFIIERSSNGNGFTNIGRLPGAGTSLQENNYAFTDLHPTPGTNYYRLKQVDFDGRFSYSPVVSAFWGEEEGFRIYPTLVSSGLHVEMPESWQGGADIFVFDGLGQVRKTWHLDGTTQEVSLDVGDLQPGIFIIKAVSGRRRAVMKFEKI